MNKQQALSLLELNNDASSDDINNAFRKLAKKYHPDRNKDNPEAEAKFKEINSAYQYLNNPQPERNQSTHNVDMNDIFNQMFRNNRNPFQQHRQAPQSVAYTTITFAESVLGTEKDIEIDQNKICPVCLGNGFTQDSGNCGVCGGRGQKTANFSRDNMVFIESCGKCHGTGKNLKPCNTCNNQCGYTSTKANIHVRIPGGVQNENVLRIPGSLIKINVVPDPDMNLVDYDVISDIEISLLDALKGVSKPVRTVKGEMSLKIPPNIKNGNSVQVHGYGVDDKNGHVGSHIFNVRVNYPENDKIEELIKVLEKPKADSYENLQDN